MKIGRYLCMMLLVFSLTSCDEIARKFGYAPVKSTESTGETNKSQNYSEEFSRPTVIDEFDVEADVYKIVPDYYGSASGKEVYKGTETLHIKVYSNGNAYAGAMSIYRAVGEAGTRYDFNCFNNSTSKSYYFNSSKLR